MHLQATWYVYVLLLRSVLLKLPNVCVSGPPAGQPVVEPEEQTVAIGDAATLTCVTSELEDAGSPSVSYTVWTQVAPGGQEQVRSRSGNQGNEGAGTRGMRERGPGK